MIFFRNDVLASRLSTATIPDVVPLPATYLAITPKRSASDEETRADKQLRPDATEKHTSKVRANNINPTSEHIHSGCLWAQVAASRRTVTRSWTTATVPDIENTMTPQSSLHTSWASNSAIYSTVTRHALILAEDQTLPAALTSDEESTASLLDSSFLSPVFSAPSHSFLDSQVIPNLPAASPGLLQTFNKRCSMALDGHSSFEEEEFVLTGQTTPPSSETLSSGGDRLDSIQDMLNAISVALSDAASNFHTVGDDISSVEATVLFTRKILKTVTQIEENSMKRYRAIVACGAPDSSNGVAASAAIVKDHLNPIVALYRLRNSTLMDLYECITDIATAAFLRPNYRYEDDLEYSTTEADINGPTKWLGEAKYVNDNAESIAGEHPEWLHDDTDNFGGDMSARRTYYGQKWMQTHLSLVEKAGQEHGQALLRLPTGN